MQKLRKGPAALLFLSLLAMVRKIAPRGPCDPLVPEYCQLPFPNSFFTVLSPHTPTGVQVNFSTHSFPVDVLGRLTNLTEWNTFGKRLCVYRRAREVMGGANYCTWLIQLSSFPSSSHSGLVYTLYISVYIHIKPTHVPHRRVLSISFDPNLFSCPE